MKLTWTTTKLAGLTLLGFLLALFVGLRAQPVVGLRQHRRRQHEGFLPLVVPLAGLAITATGADKKIAEKVGEKIGGGGGGAPAYQPTYRGREWDGADWSCPAGSIETGNADNSKACITSQYHPPVWKWDGKTWGHHCPNGTVPSGDGTWEKKCEVGWMYRIYDGSKWVCAQGTEDSGKTWSAPGNEGHKQCKRGRAYTLRVFKDGKWVCPDTSKDTGRSWGQPNEWDQCKWTGP